MKHIATPESWTDDPKIASHYSQQSIKQFEPLLPALNKDQLGNVDDAWKNIASSFNNIYKEILNTRKNNPARVW